MANKYSLLLTASLLCTLACASLNLVAFASLGPPISVWVADPVWVNTALVLFLALTTLSGCLYVKHRRREKRVTRGLCVRCGYDLRGSSERCPECGAGVGSKQSAVGSRESC